MNRPAPPDLTVGPCPPSASRDRPHRSTIGTASSGSSQDVDLSSCRASRSASPARSTPAGGRCSRLIAGLDPVTSGTIELVEPAGGGGGPSAGPGGAPTGGRARLGARSAPRPRPRPDGAGASRVSRRRDGGVCVPRRRERFARRPRIDPGKDLRSASDPSACGSCSRWRPRSSRRTSSSRSSRRLASAEERRPLVEFVRRVLATGVGMLIGTRDEMLLAAVATSRADPRGRRRARGGDSRIRPHRRVAAGPDAGSVMTWMTFVAWAAVPVAFALELLVATRLLRSRSLLVEAWLVRGRASARGPRARPGPGPPRDRDRGPRPRPGSRAGRPAVVPTGFVLAVVCIGAASFVGIHPGRDADLRGLAARRPAARRGAEPLPAEAVRAPGDPRGLRVAAAGRGGLSVDRGSCYDPRPISHGRCPWVKQPRA